MIKTFSKFLKKLAKTLNGDVFDMAFCLFNLSDTLVCEYATGYTLNSQNLYTEEMYEKLGKLINYISSNTQNNEVTNIINLYNMLKEYPSNEFYNNEFL